MEDTGLIRRSHSKTSIADTGHHPTSSNYYWGIYEFPQGGSPRIVEESETPIITKKNDFLWSVVNTPFFKQGQNFDPRPVIVRSYFERVFWVAVFVQVRDVQARGFSRPIVFVVANQRSENIEWVSYLYRRNLEELAEQLQKSAREVFAEELKRYVNSICKCAEQEPENESLRSKIKELEDILPEFGIKREDCESAGFEAREAAYFLCVNNNLRGIENLIKWQEIKADVCQFVNSLPKEEWRIKVQAFDASVGLGELADDVVDLLAKDFQNTQFTLSKLKQEDLEACVFSLLSGKVLVLVSKECNQGAMELAKELSILSPFGRPFSIAKEGEGKESDYPKFSIIVAQSQIKLASAYSIMDLDISKFAGEKCPDKSFLRTEAACTQICRNDSENSLLVYLFQLINERYGRFLWTLADMSERTCQTEERMRKSLQFHEDDTPILKYWMACRFNRHRQRPILISPLSNNSCVSLPDQS